MTSTAPASAPKPTNAPKIVCFGETLFDLLPDGKHIGGAPLNVAYHVNKLGGQGAIISRIGNDELGQELTQFVGKHGLDSIALQTDDELATGTVPVTFLDQNTPSYEIVSPVAWDRIEANDEARSAASGADAIVFGSLATRSAQNLESLSILLLSSGVRVLDVNLRAPFFEAAKVLELLRHADIVKVNDEEIRLIGEWHGWSGTDEELLHQLHRHLNLKAAVLTRGKHGAALVDDNGFYEHPGFHIIVADTIGAGDSFLAAFITKYLVGVPPTDCLAYAGAVGALVAGKTGGTPAYTTTDVLAVLKNTETNKIFLD